MLAMQYTKYGAADVVQPVLIETPKPGAGQIRVKVEAAGVTTADWRLRASAFPGGLWLAGRLMMGLFRPRRKTLGGDFAGVVDAVGEGVTSFKPGDPVFGFSQFGAHAEYLVMPATGAVVHRPATLTAVEAAALPFGAICALDFLRDQVRLTAGQTVLIVGASGGVGVYAVQIAKALGADVTAVASGANAALAMDLGADRFVDYKSVELARLPEQFDLIFDTVGALDFSTAKGLLRPAGLFLPLNFGLKDIGPALLPARGNRPRMKLHVNTDTQDHLKTLCEMVEAGALRPVVDQVYPLRAIAAAYAHVESRHRRGAVVLKVAAAGRPVVKAIPVAGPSPICA